MVTTRAVSVLSETVDFLRALAVSAAVPIHDAIRSSAGTATYTRVLGGLAPGIPLWPIDGERSPRRVLSAPVRPANEPTAARYGAVTR